MDTLKLFLPLEDFLLMTVELCSKVEPGVWEEDRGTCFWSPVQLWKGSSVFVCFAVTDSLVHSVVPEQLELP